MNVDKGSERTPEIIRYQGPQEDGGYDAIQIGPLLPIAVLLIISFMVLIHFDSVPMLALGLFMSISGAASLILFSESRKPPSGP